MSSVDTTQITHFFSSLTLAKLPPAIITFIIAYAASRVVLKVADKLFTRSRMEKTIEKFLRSALRILMWALIFLIVAGSLGIDVSSMIALLSVASLAVTLAVQGALSNLASGGDGQGRIAQGCRSPAGLQGPRPLRRRQPVWRQRHRIRIAGMDCGYRLLGRVLRHRRKRAGAL